MHGTYEFRKEMLQIHRPDTLDEQYIPNSNEICLDAGRLSWIKTATV